jgi:hypothetical protein
MGLEPTTFCMASASDRARPFAPVRSNPCFAWHTFAYPNASAPERTLNLAILAAAPAGSETLPEKGGRVTVLESGRAAHRPDAERGEIHPVDGLVDLAAHPRREEVDMCLVSKSNQRGGVAYEVGIDARILPVAPSP